MSEYQIPGTGKRETGLSGIGVRASSALGPSRECEAAAKPASETGPQDSKSRSSPTPRATH